MMAIILIFLASCCASLSNFFFRKNLPYQSSHFYLLSYYIGSLLFSFILYPHLWKTPINWVALGLGSSVGALNVAMMATMAQALKKGPSGLTFAFQNATAVFPGTLLYLLFGSDFGFSFSYFQLAGMAMVVYGLFLGAKNEGETTKSHQSKWLIYALACGLFQVIALTLMQGRCVLFQEEKLGIFLSRFALQEGEDSWFMPAQFGTAALLQALFFFNQIKGQVKPISSGYGLAAGLTNGACTFLILLSTKLALPSFKVVLFPCFAAITIILCNLWAYKIYNERFNIKTNFLCAAGILIGILA